MQLNYLYILKYFWKGKSKTILFILRKSKKNKRK